jgi:hypothetical protein
MSEQLRIDIDGESFRRLMEIATRERRPIGWQAEVLLIKAIADYERPAPKASPVDGP